MVEEFRICIGFFLAGLGIGALIMSWFDHKMTSILIDKFYDEHKAMVNKFYTEMQEQSDKFFSIMKTYLPKGDDNG